MGFLVFVVIIQGFKIMHQDDPAQRKTILNNTFIRVLMIPIVIVVMPFVAYLMISLSYVLMSAIFGQELFENIGYSVYVMAGGFADV